MTKPVQYDEFGRPLLPSPEERQATTTSDFVAGLTGWQKEAWDRFSPRNQVRVNLGANVAPMGEGMEGMDDNARTTYNPTLEHLDTASNKWFNLEQRTYTSWAAADDAEQELGRIRTQIEEFRQRELTGRVQYANDSLRATTQERQILQGGSTPSLSDTLIHRLSKQIGSAAPAAPVLSNQGSYYQGISANANQQQSLLANPDYVARQRPPNRGNPTLQVTTSSLLQNQT